MAGTPFFRGPNRTDWLVATMIQTACDFGTETDIVAAASVVGPATVYRFGVGNQLYPSVTLVVTDGYVFVVSGSTRTGIQWVGNVLGSVAVPAPSGTGQVSAYFLAVAQTQLAACQATLSEQSPGRRVVLLGFSLGGASVTVIKDILSKQYGTESACVAFGNPQPGTPAYAAAYDVSNYSGFGVVNDPIPSVPPSPWSGIGLHNSWIPYPTLVDYSHVTSGYTLGLDGAIRPGYSLQTTSEIVLGFDLGLWQKYHNQGLYAELLRGSGLPYVLTDGYDGFPGAGGLDNVAVTLFDRFGVSWPWATVQPTFMRFFNMGCQFAFYIRDAGSPPLGFQEIYYFPGNDPSVPFNAAQSSSGNWIQARAKFLSSSCQIYALRSSLVGSPRQSYLTKFTQPVAGLVGAQDTIEDCITFLGYSSTQQYKRQFHFRGIPSTWLTADNLSSTGRGMLPLIYPGPSSFVQLLINNGLCIKSGGGNFADVLTISAGAQATANSLITLTFSPTVAIANNSLFSVRGCKGAPLLNGIWQAVGTSPAGQVILSGSQRYSCPAALSGTIKLISPYYFSVSTLEFNGVGSKKTGRPSFLQRGRASAKLKHR